MSQHGTRSLALTLPHMSSSTSKHVWIEPWIRLCLRRMAVKKPPRCSSQELPDAPVLRLPPSLLLLTLSRRREQKNQSSRKKTNDMRTSRTLRRKTSLFARLFSPPTEEEDEEGDSAMVEDFVGGSAYVPIGWHPTSWAKSTLFDTVACGVIVLNTIVMGVEIQYKGIHAGYVIGFPQYTFSSEQVWPGAHEFLDASEICFGSLFCLELILKVISFRVKLLLNPWNWLDIIVVLAFLVERIFGELPVDPMPLRLARLARLLRLLRLVRTIQGFDALYVITTSFKGSVSILTWSFALLFVLQLMFSFFLNQMVMHIVLDPRTPEDVSMKLFAYFGTSTRALLSLFELTLANWPPIARMLQDDVSEAWVLFSLMHKLTIGFAVVGIINGVFMQETFKAAASDDVIMMRQAEKKRNLHMKKMVRLFQHADTSGDGNLGRSEFRGVMNNAGVQSWLLAQELNVSDPDLLFEMLKNDENEITAEGLVAGVARLAGSAKSLDLVALQTEHKSSDQALREVLRLTRHSHSVFGLASDQELLRSESMQSSGQEPVQSTGQEPV